MRTTGEQTGSLVRWIGHDASIYNGNSGGPLVSFAGEIIGINEVGLAGIGGAIPADIAQSVAKQLIETGDVKRSWVGAGCQPRLKSQSEDKGVLIASVLPNSPAAKAGIQPGDLMLSFDGQPTNARINEDIPHINNLTLSTPIGKTVAVKLLRAGKEVTVSLTTEGRGKAQGDDEELGGWGMTGQDLTRFSALALHRPGHQGRDRGHVAQWRSGQ